MSVAERVELENFARPMMKHYVERAAREGKTAPSLMPMLRDVLLRGCFVDGSADGNSLRLTPTQQWLVNVSWLMATMNEGLGPCASGVLIARLTRRAKSEEFGFTCIAQDVSARVSREQGREVVLLATEAETLYRDALLRFVELCRERGIGREVSSASEESAMRYVPPADLRSDRALIRIGQRLQAIIQRREQKRRQHRNDRAETIRDVSHGATM
jgi:hypothetical protein